MDRNIVYPGAIPLDTDVLSAQRNAMIALGFLARATLGTTTVVDGLACTQQTVPNMTFNVGQGSILSLQNVDATSYGSLAADTTDPLVKVGINIAPTVFTVTAPGVTGQSINYLIQAAFSEADANSVILPYYNASNPAVAFSGPGNSGTPQNTLRTQTVNLGMKTGAAATTGSQTTPAPDSGFIGLWVVTVAFGQTSVVTGNISMVSGAPFVDPLAVGRGVQPGRLLKVQTFTASGTYVPTAGMKTVIFEVQGGGAAGAGAGGAASGNVSLGAPGTSGAYAKGLFTAASVGVSQAVTVGIGGVGVSNAAGTNGGSSSVGSLIIAPGGIGGGLFNNAAVPTANGNGSASSAPTGGNIIAAVGVAGSPSVAFSTTVALGGQGGVSVFGGSTPTSQVNTTGVSALNPGSGGGGIALNNSGGSGAGGAGFRGVVIAYEYS